MWYRLSEPGVTIKKSQKGGGDGMSIRCALLFLLLCAPQIADADTGTQTRAHILDEIIVTARKREENLQQVPISVSVATGQQIRADNLNKLQDLAPMIPSLFVSENVSADSIHIRGVGSGENFGFEQTVGQVVDGFFYGRSRFSRLQFLDVERVEVLKGPQGALIGKNTSAGAVSITTLSPTDQPAAWIVPTWEFDGDEGITIEGGVSGPIQDTLKGRLAVRVDDRDGYVSNTANGSSVQSTDDWSVRSKLLWEPTETFALEFSWMHGDYDRFGKPDQLADCNAFMLGFLAMSGSTSEDCTTNLTTTGAAPRNGVGNFENLSTTLDTVGITFGWELGGHTLTSLTGYAEFDYTDDAEGDHTQVESISGTFREDYEQWSQELRLTSPGGRRFDYIVGLFYLDTDQVFDLELNLNLAPIVGAPAPVGFTNLTVTAQETETLAVFGEATWHVNEHWAATIGGRYTDEDKDATQQQMPLNLYGDTPLSMPPPGFPPPNSHDVTQDRSESNFSPTIDLVWRPNDDVMVYGSFRRGYKGGGFDHQLDASQDDAEAQFQFEEEEVDAWELGAKTMLAGGRAQLNVAAFRNEFEDLQLSVAENTPTGLAVFRVGNAASATVEGIELDLRWRPLDRLTLSGALTWLNAEYDDYDGAPCFNGQTLEQGCVSGSQELDGKDLRYVPEWAGVADIEYLWSLPRGLTLGGCARAVYTGEYSLVTNLDPNLRQESSWKYDARLTLSSSSSERWEVSLIGRNLTDEITSSNGNELPAVFVGSYFRFVDPPRQVALQGTWRY